MKTPVTVANIISLFVLTCSLQPLLAQGYGGTLTFEGLERAVIQSAGVRAMGGVTFAARRDAGIMFHNPAALHTLDAIQISVGGQATSRERTQEQNFAPVRFYPNLSLLLEGRTTFIPDPDTSLVGFTAQDTVQRPYDAITPNWSQSDDDRMPLQAFVAIPLSVGDFRFVLGAGGVRYANLNHYYQNNNVFSPGILGQRPLPTFRPTDDDPLEVAWLQTVRSRQGSVQGYGFALAGAVEKIGLSLGVSGLFLDGSSDDVEHQIGRGDLTFYSNAFRIDSVYSRITRTGTSDFSGREFTLSGALDGRFVGIGVAIKLPETITRSYAMTVSTDTTGTPTLTTIEGEDELKLPWRGVFALRLTPREILRLTMEYEHRPYASAEYTNAAGASSNPWLSSGLFRLGAELMAFPWLAVRGGMRGEAEVFQPEGNKLEGDPVGYSVYSAGLGVLVAGVRLNVTYENALVKYQDVWSGLISRNRERRHLFLADLSYDIPWSR